MLAKKFSGYRQIPLADIGSPIQIVLSTPDDSECEEDSFDKVSDITIESGKSLSLQLFWFYIDFNKYLTMKISLEEETRCETFHCLRTFLLPQIG
ncbi:hypothetical protein TNCT_505661 [Trichonephila clavata]|uniref:Uncharacterized protein n=1 Tax=Trichonephila clavata TaxID=2740835 RepID=A0A8X6GA30_TRICU|nr:hypothetical protein TNCT_505661 [Trichonephila clavata]